MKTNRTKPKIIVCLGSSCFARGNGEIIKVVEEYLQKNNYRDEIDLEISGTLCQEHCADGPNILVNNVIHYHVDPGVVLDILKNILPEQVSPQSVFNQPDQNQPD